MKDREKVTELKRDAEDAKMRLCRILSELEETPGCKGEAAKLDKIICRLEAWQNS